MNLKATMAIIFLFAANLAAAADIAPNPLIFDFGGLPTAGHTLIQTPTKYDAATGYGFDLGSLPQLTSAGFWTSDQPFFFSIKLPEGNYDVTLTLGDPAGESTTTVKAESRRLMLENIHAPTGKLVSPTFTVNVRTPAISGTTSVKLKEREKDYLHWDDKLTLEFSGARPCVSRIEIRPSPPQTLTIYLAGDSTVTDQPAEPYNSWGQMLPRFFKPGVAIANHAESGESLKSFLGARRLDKILATVRPGDYLFIQFGHNDQKDKSPGAGAFTTYKQLLEKFIAEARDRKAIPVLITPVSRRSFGDDGRIANNLGDFPQAVRRVAAEQNVALIDLNEMSQRFYEALGPEKSKLAFAPGDNTHHDNYGSYELARCIVEGIRRARLDLVNSLADDARPFDPAHPDPLEQFAIPASPRRPG
jgi:lysophospholipase L1-like esterase